MLTKAKRDEIRARADAATKGPWEARYDLLWSQLGHRLALFYLQTSDTKFCAHARDDIPALLDDLDAQDAEIQSLKISVDCAIAVGKSWEHKQPFCGHENRFGHTDDGGKTTFCAMCQIAERDGENARLIAENDRLIVIAKADEWQARYWAEHDAVADREAAIMAERAKAAAMRRALEEILCASMKLLADHVEQLAAYRKALEPFAARWLQLPKWMRDAAKEDGRITCGGERLTAADAIHFENAEAALQSSDPGKALLDAHAAELAKWEEFRDVSIADGADLRQRLEAAELFRATLERPHGLHSGQCCDPVIDGEICALLRRMEAAEAALATLRGLFLIDAYPVAICQKCNGTGVDCCPIGHSRECLCLLCAWRRDGYEKAQQLNRAESELATLRASQAADLNRIEESYNRLIRELEEGKRKAEAERDAAKRDTARLDWLLEKRYRHNGQIRIEVGEPSIWEEFPTPREAIDVAMQSDAPEDQ